MNSWETWLTAIGSLLQAIANAMGTDVAEVRRRLIECHEVGDRGVTDVKTKIDEALPK